MGQGRPHSHQTVIGQENGVVVPDGMGHMGCQLRRAIGGIGGQGNLVSGKSHQVMDSGYFPVETGKGGGIGGVGVHHGSDIPSPVVQGKVKSQLTGRQGASLADGTVRIHNDNIRRGQTGVFNAAGGDGNAALPAVEAADVASGAGGEARREHFFAKGDDILTFGGQLHNKGLIHRIFRDCKQFRQFRMVPLSTPVHTGKDRDKHGMLMVGGTPNGGGSYCFL